MSCWELFSDLNLVRPACDAERARPDSSTGGFLTMRIVLLFSILFLVTAGADPTVLAQQSKTPTIDVAINGISTNNLDRPLEVDAAQPQRFKISVQNSTASEIHVTMVSFEGKVVGIPVFRCEGLLSLLALPGESVSQEFDMSADCLQNQATGLMTASVSVYGVDKSLLTSWPLTLSVKGSLRTIYGLFGIALAGLTILSILGGLVALARHRLSPNRWSRAMRFAFPGIGLGFTIVFALAAGNVAVPTATMWIPVVGACFALLGLFGYFSPRPDEVDDFAYPQQIDAADTVMMAPEAVPTISAPQTPLATPSTSHSVPEYGQNTLQTPFPPPSQTVRRIAPEESESQ